MVTAVLTAAVVVVGLGQSDSLPLSSLASALAPLPVVTGPTPARGTTALTSAADDGKPLVDESKQQQISGNGQWQIFTTDSYECLGCFGVDFSAPDPLFPDDDQTRVFVRNLNPGAPVNHRTIQVSIGHADFGGGSPSIVTPDGTTPDGASSMGTVSADGRYVAFVTDATNIVPNTVGPNPLTLVVCDRAPNGTFDAVLPGAEAGTFTRDYRCRNVYSTSSNAVLRIDTSYPPRLSPDGSLLVWTRQNDANGDDVMIAGVSDNHGLLDDAAAGTPTEVKGQTATASNSDPSVTNGGVVVMLSEEQDGTNKILQTIPFADPQIVDRVDVDPDDSTKFLGDRVFGCDTTECPVTLDQPSQSDNGFEVMFGYQAQDQDPSFHRMVFVHNAGFSTQRSEIISRGNPTAGAPQGAVVESDIGAISGDGRYVVFEVQDEGTHDGTPNPDAYPEEFVARDVELDADRVAQGLPRLPGALVTADANDDCTPVAPAIYCDSVDYGYLPYGDTRPSFSSDGSKISFYSMQEDLIAGDTETTGDVNGEGDVFVRTWQPALSTTSTDFGDVQIGTHSILQIPVQVVGFGAITLGQITIGGADPAQFLPGASSCDSETFHTGDTCVVVVQATPTTPGTKTATVSINSPQFDDPIQVATVTVNGVTTGSTAARADITRTSVRDGDDHQSPNGGTNSMISGNGRWQVFESDSNLAGHTPIDPDDAGDTNIFVRDLADPQRTTQISLHSALAGSITQPSRPARVKGHPTGASPDSSSFDPSISSDGRFVSFMTSATDIVPMPPLPAGDDPDFVLVVCDRDPSGAVDADGNPVLDLPRPGTTIPDYACFPVQSGRFFGTDGPGLDNDSKPQLSGNGTRIAWLENVDFSEPRVRVATLSTVGGALSAPTNFRYVPSTVPGFLAGTTRVSGDAWQSDPVLSENGNRVAFIATDCTAGPCTREAVVETDLTTNSSLRFDIAPGGAVFLGNTVNADFDPPAMSDSGDVIAFAFRPDNDSIKRVYVATRNGDAVTSVLESRDNQGNPSAGAEPALSGNGRYLAFQTSRPNESNGVDPPDGECFDNGDNAAVDCQIVARDLVKDVAFFSGDAPWTPSEIVSNNLTNACPNPLPVGRKCGANGDSFNPSVDATGSEIGFDSDASDLVTGDTNQNCSEGCFPAIDSFVHTWRPLLTVVPGFNFGTVALGAQKSRTYTVTSSGFGPISLGPVEISGGNPGDFIVLSDGCAGRTLNDQQTCTFRLRFKPTATGLRTADLAYPIAKNSYPRHNPDNSISFDPALLVQLTGVGQGTGAIVVAPSTIDFGSRLPLADGPAKSMTITNGGGASVLITGITVQDSTVPGASGDYTVNATDCLGVLLPGQSCVVTITFVGHKTGHRDAQIVITDDVTPTPTVVTLVARVPKPKILVNPGVISPGRVTSISGTGFAPGRLVDITIKGLPESVTVRAGSRGKFEASLVIFHNAPEGPQTVIAHTRGQDKSLGADDPLLISEGTVDDLTLVTRH